MQFAGVEQRGARRSQTTSTAVIAAAIVANTQAASSEPRLNIPKLTPKFQTVTRLKNDVTSTPGARGSGSGAGSQKASPVRPV